MGKKSYRLANTEEVQEMQETSNTRNVKGGGKKKQTLNFRHNVFKLKPGCNLNSLPDGKRTVTQCKRNQVFVLGEACPKPRMHKQVQNSKQNVPGHWCT